MRPNKYKLIQHCVDIGTVMGWRQAYKHTDNPSEERVHDAIVDAIMLEISEWFDFEDTQ